MERSSLFLNSLTADAIPEIVTIEAAVHSAPWTEKSFKNELENPHSIFVVARQAGVVVGYGGAWILVDEAHVTNVTVAEDKRQQGIAKKILTELLLKSVAKGAICSTLEVRKSNVAAISLYEKFGYQQVTVRKKYYPDNQEDAVVMWLYDLEEWRPPV